jgi:hypothetical protein
MKSLKSMTVLSLWIAIAMPSAASAQAKDSHEKAAIVHCEDWFKSLSKSLHEEAVVPILNTSDPEIIKADPKKTFIGNVPCGESLTLLSDLSMFTKVRSKQGVEGYMRGTFLGLPESKEQSDLNKQVAGLVKDSDKILKQADKTERESEKLLRGGEKICAQNLSWSADDCVRISQHQMWVGMDWHMLYKSVGRPHHINTTYLAGGHSSQQLVFEKSPAGDSDPGDVITDLFTSNRFFGYVYCEDGIVTAIQASN